MSQSRTVSLVAAVAGTLLAGLLVHQRPVRGGGNLDGLVNGFSEVAELKWSEHAVPVRWLLNENGAANNFNNGNATSLTVEDVKDAVEQAFFTWAAVNTSTIDFDYHGTTTKAGVALDGKNVVTWLDPDAMGGAPYLAIAPSFYLTAELEVGPTTRDLNLDGNADLDPEIYPDGTILPAGTIVDADISFNSDSYDWVTSPVGGSTIFDIQAIATHEIGHFHGVSHSSLAGPAPTMFPFVLSSIDFQESQRTLAPDDRAASSRVYPEAHFATSFASIAGRVILDGPGNQGGDGVSVFAVDAVTMEPVLEVFSVSRFDILGRPTGSFTLDGLPPGSYLVGARFFDGADEIGLFVNRYNTTIGLSNVNNGNASSGDGVGLPYAPRPEFYDAGDDATDDLKDATVIEVASPGSSHTGVDIIINKEAPPAPAGATPLLLGDDAFKEVLFTSGFAFTFYDTVYEAVNVGSNGYLTFGAGDTDYSESVDDFGGPEPRIACLFDDLDPGSGGTGDAVDVYVKQSFEEMVITYLGVPEAGNAPANTLVVTLDRSGQICFDYHFVRSRDSIVGISPGGSEPALHELDFSGEVVYEGGIEEGIYEKFTSIKRPFDLWGGKLTFVPDNEGGYRAEFFPPSDEIDVRITALNPDHGPEAGGTVVTVTGFGFAEDSTVSFGDTPATGLDVVSATKIVCTTPAGVGTVDVLLSNSQGSDTREDGFSYLPPPQLVSVSPEFGPESGGTLVTLTGTSFGSESALTGEDGLKVRFGGNLASDVTLISNTKITARSPEGEGMADVQVENDNGTSTLEDAFEYTPPPVLLSVSPEEGPWFGGTHVTLTGQSFSPHHEIAVYFGEDEADILEVAAESIIVEAPPGEGVVDVSVETDAGSDGLNDAFAYIPPPSLVSVSPVAGPQSGGTRITLTGTGFHTEGGLIVHLGESTATDVEVVNTTQILATTPAGTGTVDVQVTNGYGSTTKEDAFTYLLPPVLTLVSPRFGPEEGGTLVTLTGSHFDQGGEVTVLFGGSALLEVDLVSSTKVIGITPAGEGSVNVSLENANGSALLENGFEYGIPPDIECRIGNVNENAGPIADVLFLNGSPGNEDRVVEVSRDTPVTCTVEAPPSMETAHYAMYIHFGAPLAENATKLPFAIGTTCFPIPLTGGFPQPVIIANNLGWPRILGHANLPSVGAPEELFFLKFGTRFPRTLFIQGLMEDDTDPAGISVSNGVLLISN